MGIIVSLLLASGTVYVSDAARPEGVTVGVGEGGTLLTGPAGTPLYTFDGNTGFDKDCQDECLVVWPPLLAQAEDKPIGDWVPRRRADGIMQWAYKGSLVYGYAADREARRATGDGMGSRWHALRFVGATPRVPVPASAQVAKAGAKFRLVDHRGFTLYTFARDAVSPACREQCLEVWPPLRAPALAQPIGNWTPVDRSDGIRQWSYRGRLVYGFTDDQLPGEARGEGADGVWQTVEVTARDAAGTVAGEKR